MDDAPDEMEAWLGADGLIRFRARDGSGPTDWNGDETSAAARALRALAETAADGPSRRVERNATGVFKVGDDGPYAGDIGGAVGVRAVTPDGGPFVLTASEAREFAAALETLADEDDKDDDVVK